MSPERVAIYPGSYDPLTNGHIDIIHRGLNIFDQIIVAVLENPSKKTLFSIKERLAILKTVFQDEKKIEIDWFEGLLVEYMKRRGAHIVVRGLRAISDFDIEFQMALMNRKIDPGIDTIFLVPSIRYSYLSSKLVKEIYQLGGEITTMVPEIVDRKIKEKFGRR